MSKTALRKVGSSLVATIPLDVIQDLHLRKGQKPQINEENRRIVPTPVIAATLWAALMGCLTRSCSTPRSGRHETDRSIRK
jgi:antitoxin component of MazEF toxin-antitoxin module